MLSLGIKVLAPVIRGVGRECQPLFQFIQALDLLQFAVGDDCLCIQPESFPDAFLSGTGESKDILFALGGRDGSRQGREGVRVKQHQSDGSLDS